MSNFGFYPDLRPNELEGTFFSAQAAGYYLKSLARYGSAGDSRWAAIFLPSPPGQPINQRLVAESSVLDVQNHVDEMAQEGFYPVGITATGGSGDAPHSLWFQQQAGVFAVDVQMTVAAGLSWNEFQRAQTGFVTTADQAGANLHSIDIFRSGSSGGLFVSAIIHKNPAVRTLWNPILDEYDGSTWWSDPRYTTMQRGWNRPEAVIPVSGPVLNLFEIPSVLTLWRGDTLEPWPADMNPDAFTGGTFSRGPLFVSTMVECVETLKAGGYWPIHVGANGIGGDARLCVTFAKSGQTQPLLRATAILSIRDPFEPQTMPLAQYAGPKHPLASWHAMLAADNVLPESSSRSRIPRWQTPPGSSSGVGGTPPPQPQPLPSSAAAEVALGDKIGKSLSKPDPFAQWLVELMRLKGARAAQLSVARNGRLVYSKAFTHAEPGYPLTHPKHVLRIGSVSKLLTGLALVDKLETAEQLNTSLVNALAINPSPINVPLALIRIQDALRHRTGWGGTSDPDHPSTIDEARIEKTLSIPAGAAQAGDVSRLLNVTHDSVFRPDEWGVPRGHVAYNNWNFAVLGELVSFLYSSQKSRSQYESEMGSYWGLARERAHVVVADWTSERVYNAAPAHSRQPAYIIQKGGSIKPSNYAYNWQIEAGAGSWVISTVDLSRIVSALDSTGTAAFGWTNEKVRLLHSAYSPWGETGVHDGGGLGCYYKRYGTHLEVVPLTIYHNGEVDGGSAVVFHRIPTAGPVTPSLTIALALNLNAGLGDDEIMALQAMADGYEASGASWGGEDLFSLAW